MNSGTVVSILFFVVIIGGYLAYAKWLEKGMAPREFSTTVSAETLRQIFVDKVARTGWKVVDDGNPLVAQSTIMTGIRQQLALTLSSGEGATHVWFGPHRWVTSNGVPKKAHTIRLRMNSFEEAVRTLDPSIQVERLPLQGR